MDQVSPIERPSGNERVKEPSADVVSVSSRTRSVKTDPKTWRPTALRPIVLVFTIFICWALIAVLQVLLLRSQRNGGLIFAASVNELPISDSFLYLYFPTVVAVVFSMYWAWIDLDTKRMEPYYQLSKKDGALGKDSLLLQYPFDFLPLVPFKALRDRHWPVFWASFAVVLVAWGLVPTQAGIFSTKTTTRVIDTPFHRSTAFVPASEQTSRLSFRYAQSVYSIATLNETLTGYMSRNYTLAPFLPSTDADSQTLANGNWTAETTLYSLDLNCEPAAQSITLQGTIVANSTNGCSFGNGLNGNLTIDLQDSDSSAIATKEYTAMFVGYANPFGFADYSLDYDACPKESNHTFYAAMQRNKARDDAPPNDVTAIYCWPTYYRRRVSATVDSQSLIPLHVEAIGEKEAIPDDLFNSTWLEIQMIGTSSGFEVRADVLPTRSTPKYLETISKLELSLTTGPMAGGGFVQPMVGLSVALADRPLKDFLDWQVLAKSYADAYRLMFARAMRDVLDVKASSDLIVGQTQIGTEAVVMVPLFVYVVESLLGVVSLATIALLYLSLARTRNLRSDPSTIAAIMSLVADNVPLLSDFENLDCCTAEAMQDIVAKKRYKLVGDDSQVSLEQIHLVDEDLEGVSTVVPVRQGTLAKISKPIRPTEFSLWVAGLIITLFVTLSAGLITIFVKARAQGLPLPSRNTIVQNLLENYIPTALATLIEPIWVLFNRILCLLQPIEQLQACKAKAKDSIDLNYSSLPPQLVIFRAIRSRHLVLAAVCAMALLANVLAITFAGLFLHKTIDMQHAVALHPPYEMKFVSINGTVGPDASQTFGSLTASGAYQGGTGEDQFLIAESNYTSQTPLPAWVDDSMFYMPFLPEQGNLTTPDQYEADTEALGARLECKALTLGADFEAALSKPIETVQAIRPQLNVTIEDGSTTVICTNRKLTELRPGPIGGGCSNGTLAAELVFQLLPLKANATLREQKACMSSVVLGWIRTNLGSCAVVPRSLSDQNSTFVQCRPKLTRGHATIRVDQGGRLQRKVRDLTMRDISESDQNSSQMFSNDPENLISQSNKYLFPDGSPAWHNDSFADDPFNYFVHRVGGATKFLDPKESVPAIGDIEESLQKAYSYLFAIWLGINKDKLLVSSANEQSSSLQGWRVQPEQRVFMSTPMFAISLAILCIYAVVAIFVYTRRPGQYLPRLPTTIASVIALFAASAAVQDMRGTSELNAKGRSQHLKALDARYGYGSFIGGGDGRVHIGIEKTPFVRVRSKTTWIEKKVTMWRKGSAV